MPIAATRRQPDSNGHLWLAEGEYGQCGLGGIWYCRPHGHHTGSLEHHDVVEHADGTITVSPSILLTGPNGQWHGYLEHGQWREV